MAVIRCRLKDGYLHVEEVLEFQKGDTITVEKSARADAEFNGEIFDTIPCPSIMGGIKGEFDCWTLRRPILGKAFVIKK
jgi:hypothetical protein